MNYKEFCKKDSVIVTKARILKKRLVLKQKMKDIAFLYSMGKNTITNIVNIFENKASFDLKRKF